MAFSRYYLLPKLRLKQFRYWGDWPVYHGNLIEEIDRMDEIDN